ncbi:MAG: selenium cofactor biosynthesis protein YqeC [Acidimicrobiia bacterium]|nr:selenium cofactor biosynthesis protein YqeC [Acidimicrobiia bacterium]
MAQQQVTLAAKLGLRQRELISLVGGGGKSTLLFALGAELAGVGRHVVLTTTTKMGRFQIGADDTVCPAAELDCLRSAWAAGAPALLLTGGDEHKVTGPPPEDVDTLFSEPDIDVIVVEADGSHGKPLKAPAAHEPVIPATSTLVVIVMGIDAIGRPMEEVTHRIGEARRFTNLQADHILTPADCADVLLHPEGALRSCPPGSRVVVAVTKVASETDEGAARELATVVTARSPEIATVVLGSVDT